MDNELLWSLIIVLVSMLLSGFFSGMEIAFVSSSKVRAEIEIARGGYTNRILNLFYSHRDMLISTLLVGNNIVNVVYSIGMAKLLTVPLRPLVGSNEFLLLLLQTLISTVLILFAGEFLPKATFRVNPNSTLRTFALPLYVAYGLLYPVSRFTQWLSASLMRLAGIEVQADTLGHISTDELDAYLQDNIAGHEHHNQTVEHEVKLFESALDFSDTRLRDCMVPRTDIVAVDIADTTREQLVRRFTQTGLSKIVVYRDEIDNVLGFIQVGELMVPEVDWRTRVKPVIFAPETLLARKMMTQLLEQRRSLAIVLDEFGGTAGMVTLEDLVEEIFGEIEDEHDHNQLTARQVDDHTYELSGRLEIDEINERFHLDLPESDDYQTLAGFILVNHAALPAVGETVTVGHFSLTVTHKTAARIELVRLAVNPPEETEHN